MTTNIASRYEPTLPYWVDLESIWVEGEEELSSCCGAPRAAYTAICSDCLEYGFANG